MQGFALSSLSIQGHKSLSASMLALPSPGNPCPCLSLTVSSVVTVLGLRPLHLWRDVCVEGHSALPFISRESSLPLSAEGNGPSLEGAPLLTGSGLWGEIPRTIISSARDIS